jgi:hypothetical protein
MATPKAGQENKNMLLIIMLCRILENISEVWFDVGVIKY